jgi:hypothetical protein
VCDLLAGRVGGSLRLDDDVDDEVAKPDETPMSPTSFLPFWQFDRRITAICPVCKVQLCAHGCFLQWHREYPEFGSTYCGWALHKGKWQILIVVAGQLSRFIKCFDYIVCSPRCPRSTCQNRFPTRSPVADLRTLKHTISPPRSPKLSFFFNYYRTRHRTEILRVSSESSGIPVQNYEGLKKI